ncbi:MAG: hypothetical protein IKS41_04475 [Alphaproteobacteria bacterium]|nr:hypothetical protein [Alphaproteobacteria bacterium]
MQQNNQRNSIGNKKYKFLIKMLDIWGKIGYYSSSEVYRGFCLPRKTEGTQGV